MEMTKANIPIFVAHRGCENCCVFCNQKRITGTIDDVTPQKAKRLIEEGLSRIDRDVAEIAFFGGSFTGIPMDEQSALLEVAASYVDKKHITGIRLSTRPDYINEKIIENLLKYGVTTVELGAQSMSDAVLFASKRGHTSDDIVKASQMIKESGIALGLQMMTGLPLATDESDTETCEGFIALSPRDVRIYPTLVLKDTCLCDMFEQGKYVPQTLEDAVALTAKLLERFEQAGINVIRTGLQPSDSLAMGFVAGPFHPSFGEMAQSRLIRNKILAYIEDNSLDSIDIFVEKRLRSKLSGQKRETLDFIKKALYGKVTVTEIEDGGGLYLGSEKYRII